MKQNLSAVIQKVAAFLDKTLTEEDVKLLEKHLSFESMKKNNSVNKQEIAEWYQKQGRNVPEWNFLRAGVVGTYKTELSSYIISEFDEWMKESTAGTDFTHYVNS